MCGIGQYYSNNRCVECGDNCDRCTEESRCTAFLFNKPAICWLKTQASSPIPCPSCTAGVAGELPPPAPPHPPHPRPPPPPPAPSPGCAVAADCNGCGICQAETLGAPARGNCACEVGWTGEHCERLNLGVAYKCDAGGLCLDNTTASATVGNYTDQVRCTTSLFFSPECCLVLLSPGPPP